MLKIPRDFSLSVAFAALAAIAVLTVQSLLHLPYQIRFSSPALNYWLVACSAFAVPVLLFWISRKLETKWLRTLVIVLSVLLLLPCAVIAGCATLEAPTANEKGDGSYELISEASDGSKNFRLYRTNCGATCAFGLDLREEREILWGAKLVSPMWSLYRASEGRVVVKKSTVSVLHKTDILVVLPI